MSEQTNNQLMKFDPDELSTFLLAEISPIYSFTGKLPEVETLLENLEISEQELRQLLIEEVNPKLERRGFPTYSFKPVKVAGTKRDNEFDPLFILACERILDPQNSKSFAGHMKELKPLGITTKTWDNWLSDPKYYNYAKALFDQKFDKQLDIQADLALARNIQAGDLQSIKYYKELTNKFRPMSETQLAVGTLIQVFFEIVSKHLSPEVIDTVAEELDNSPVGELMQGLN